MLKGLIKLRVFLKQYCKFAPSMRNSERTSTLDQCQVAGRHHCLLYAYSRIWWPCLTAHIHTKICFPVSFVLLSFYVMDSHLIGYILKGHKSEQYTMPEVALSQTFSFLGLSIRKQLLTLPQSNSVF